MSKAELDVEAISALRRDARFEAATRTAACGAVSLYRSNRLLNALMNDRARALFTYVALYLHYCGLPDGKPGLTAGAMRDMCVRLRLCSPGRCEAMLVLLRTAGFFTAARDADKRRRLLVPTGKLIALHQERWQAQFEAMRLVMPQAEHYCTALADPDFVKAFVVSLTERYMSGLRVLDHAPGLESLAERNAGMVILFSLALAGGADGPFPPIAPVPLSINALASAFSVSRKHVLLLLRDAEAQGLLARGGEANDRVTLLPPARDALEALFATLFLYLAQCADEAMLACAKAASSAAVTVVG